MRLQDALRRAAPGVVALCLLSAAALPAPEPRVGDPAPPFALRDLAGARRTLSDLRGRVVVVYFAMWCSTCRANTVEIQRELFLPWKDLGVQALAVDYLGNEREEVAAVARDLGLAYPVLLDDGTLTGIFGSRMAFTLVIDREGVLRYTGFYDLPKLKGLVGALAGARVEPSAPEPPRPVVTGPRPRPRRPDAPVEGAWRRPVQSFPGRSAGERFGISVLPHPADLNGDGYPDVAIGSQAADGAGGGAVSVWYGGGEGFSADPDLVLTAPVPGQKLGGSLLAADLDGDGVHDLLVGDGWARGRPRTAALHLGTRRGLSRTASWTGRGAAPGDDLGGAMATGDLDGDGLADLALGVQDRQERGAVYVYYGRPGGPPGLPDAVIRGDAARDGFGASLAVGDLDGDGLDDLVAGAPGTNGGGVDRGAAHLFRGRRTRLARTASASDADLIVDGERDMDELGGVVACAGDLDGDRVRELAIAAPGSSRGARRAGAVYLLFGPLEAAASRIPAAAATWVLLDGGAGSLFGAAVAALGDVDGDGLDDLAVGAMNAREDPARAGAVYLYRGDPERRLAPPELLLGSEEDGRLGRGVAPLGGSRFLVTETGNGRSASGAGAVHLFAFPRTSEERECSVCGMWLEDHRHTRYEVLSRDGRKRTACGAQCGLRMEVALGVRHRSAKATDFISGRPADAQGMFFVVGSEAVPEMWPSFIAFTRKADAERFQRGFGGEVLDHRAAQERARRLRRRGPVLRPSSRPRGANRCGPRSRDHA